MLPNSTDIYTQEAVDPIIHKRTDRSLQVILWALWTLAVAGTAFWHWHLDQVAGQPFNMLGMTIYCILAGLIGFIVITLVELWLEPTRFLD